MEVTHTCNITFRLSLFSYVNFLNAVSQCLFSIRPTPLTYKSPFLFPPFFLFFVFTFFLTCFSLHLHLPALPLHPPSLHPPTHRRIACSSLARAPTERDKCPAAVLGVSGRPVMGHVTRFPQSAKQRGAASSWRDPSELQGGDRATIAAHVNRRAVHLAGPVGSTVTR